MEGTAPDAQSAPRGSEATTNTVHAGKEGDDGDGLVRDEFTGKKGKYIHHM